MHVRPAQERGRANFGWLDSRHSFSFGNYYDPRFMGFRDLRVINEDRVAGGGGFPPHSHRDMEIISYVLEGALEHRDSMGNGSVIRPGDVQKMSAGTGVTHSEYNASKSEPVHFLQIWILPDRAGIAPSYDQKAFPESERVGRFRVLASPSGRDGSIRLQQDAELLAARLQPGEPVRHGLAPGRHAWLQVTKGRLIAGGAELEAGDGAALSGVETLEVQAIEPSDVLLFDLR